MFFKLEVSRPALDQVDGGVRLKWMAELVLSSRRAPFLQEIYPASDQIAWSRRVERGSLRVMWQQVFPWFVEHAWGPCLKGASFIWRDASAR